MAAANAELLERKKAEAAQQAAEDKKIAAYIADRAARDQVGKHASLACPTFRRKMWSSWALSRGAKSDSSHPADWQGCKWQH